MIVLVVNYGSSSIKFQLYGMPDEVLFGYGKVEKTEIGDTQFEFNFQKETIKKSWAGFSYAKGIKKILTEIINPENKCLNSLNEIDVVGHRLIHGSEENKSCVEVTDFLLDQMNNSVALAPLHYPANIEGIESIKKIMPEVLQAGVFDTAFHQTMPAKAFLYGIPLKWYKEHKIRRFGFHGMSHKFVSRRACEITGLTLKKSRIISCHLGNGASVAAIKNGNSVDTSMGMTPVEGLMMGTRCGDIDAGAIVFMQQNFNLSTYEIQQLINKEGGLLGLSGISADYREVSRAAKQGNADAQTALDVYYYRIIKYIGAYAAVLGGVDAIVFTGGIGENSLKTRKTVCRRMGFLGIKISDDLNRKMNGREAIISSLKSKVKVVIVPSNEELVIAREVTALAKSKQNN